MSPTTGTPGRPDTRQGAGRLATRERILVAFLQVANERGLDGATTRAVAEAAGVNEVTLFRHFRDKAGLALAAVRHFSPAERLRSRAPAIDASSPARAAAGLAACLRYCNDGIQARPELVEFGVGEARRMPEVAAEMAVIPRVVMDFLGRALAEAAPSLRPEIDPRTTVLQWMGLLVETRLLAARGAMRELSREEWDQVLEAAVRAVIDWRSDHDDGKR
jgi:AcrR family transcriptional regulator